MQTGPWQSPVCAGENVPSAGLAEGGVRRSFKDSGKCGWALRAGTGTGIDRKEIIFFQKRWTS